MNLKPKQRRHNLIDDKILKGHIDHLDIERKDRDTLILDQLQALKSLVNRKAFSLSESQIRLINKRFFNMSINRKEKLYGDKKKKNIDTIKTTTTPVFSPKISDLSAHIDKSVNRMDNDSPRKRSQFLFDYAQKYDDHKDRLRDYYK